MYVWGEAQARYVFPLMLHWKVAPASPEVKLKLADVLAVGPEGPLVIVVVGGVTSTVQVLVAGLESTFPEGSFARTEKVWLPPLSPEYACGDVQEAYEFGSSLHEKVALGSGELNANGGGLPFVVEPATGPESIAVFGAPLSRKIACAYTSSGEKYGLYVQSAGPARKSFASAPSQCNGPAVAWLGSTALWSIPCHPTNVHPSLES